MATYLFEGIRAGLLLSLLVGPLLVLLIQLSIRRGTVASLAGALGIWASDLLFVLAAHYGLNGLERVLQMDYFNEVVGVGGALMLVGVGVFMWFRPPPKLKGEKTLPGKRGLLAAWGQGFALNTFNPFTCFFWATFAITQVHDRDLPEPAAWAVYGGILGTIVITDTIKVLGARRLRERLRPALLLRAQRFGAVLLAGFGLVLAVRVWW